MVRVLCAIAGFIIFALSMNTLLDSKMSQEKGAVVTAWVGLVISTFLVSLQIWMDVLTTSVYGTNLGPVFNIGEGYTPTKDGVMIFDVGVMTTRFFGWISVIKGTFQMYSAPKQNNPGGKRKAMRLLVVGVLCANIDATIDIAGFSVGFENSFNDIRNRFLFN
jgi:hypothetical protein